MVKLKIEGGKYSNSGRDNIHIAAEAADVFLKDVSAHDAHRDNVHVADEASLLINNIYNDILAIHPEDSELVTLARQLKASRIPDDRVTTLKKIISHSGTAASITSLGIQLLSMLLG